MDATKDTPRGGKIEYTVRRSKRARRVRVNVRAHTDVEVVLPVHAPERAAAAAVRELAPWIELLLGFYFLGAIIYTFTNHNYFTAPFLILFVCGYWYTGLMSLLQGRFERWRTGVNTDESSAKPFPVGV